VEDELLSLQAELEAAMNELGQTEAARLEALQVQIILCWVSFHFLLGVYILFKELVDMSSDKQGYRVRSDFVIL
jgi:hypothetical protein